MYISVCFFGQGLLVSTAWHLVWSSVLLVCRHGIVQISRFYVLSVDEKPHHSD